MQTLAISRPFVYKISETRLTLVPESTSHKANLSPSALLLSGRGCTKQKQDLKNRKKLAFWSNRNFFDRSYFGNVDFKTGNKKLEVMGTLNVK